MISLFCAKDKDGPSVEDGAIIGGVDVISAYGEASSEETVRGSLAFCDGSKHVSRRELQLDPSSECFVALSLLRKP